MEKEICVCAAVRTKEGKTIRGHRHGDCIQAAVRYGLNPRTNSITDQGFITSKNRYVDRATGFRLQKEAGIESVAEGGYRGTILFSEDLY